MEINNEILGFENEYPLKLCSYIRKFEIEDIRKDWLMVYGVFSFELNENYQNKVGARKLPLFTKMTIFYTSKPMT